MSMDYARMLINKCKQAYQIDPNSDEAKILDLGYCGLTELPDEVFDCVWIETLVVSNDYVVTQDGKTTEIRKRHAGIPNKLIHKELPIELHQLEDLKTLLWGGDYQNKFGLESLSNFGVLTQLEYIYLNDNQITEIKGIWESSSKVLDLSSNKITKIEYLSAEATFLEELNLQSNKIAKIEGLERLKRLESLYLGFNKITEISGLANLSNLKRLELNYNKITKIEQLDVLTNLQKLDLDNNQITQIENIGQLGELKELNLASNRIQDIQGLEGLIELHFLSLDDNRITEIKGLDKLSELRDLSMDMNQIIEIKGLNNLVNLQYLYLSNNQITEIKGLNQLRNLQWLYLWGNQINMIESLNTLENIKHLNLSENQIKYFPISLLDSNTKLEKLSLYQNPIQNIPQELFGNDYDYNCLNRLRNHQVLLEIYNRQEAKYKALENKSEKQNAFTSPSVLQTQENAVTDTTTRYNSPNAPSTTKKLVILHAPEDDNYFDAFNRQLNLLNKQPRALKGLYKPRVHISSSKNIPLNINATKYLETVLSEADFTYLLVSSDFSNYTKLYNLWNLAEDAYCKYKKSCIFIAVIIRGIFYEKTFIKELKCFPQNAKSIAQSNDQDECWAEIVKKLSEMIK